MYPKSKIRKDNLIKGLIKGIKKNKDEIDWKVFTLFFVIFLLIGTIFFINSFVKNKENREKIDLDSIPEIQETLLQEYNKGNITSERYNFSKETISKFLSLIMELKNSDDKINEYDSLFYIMNTIIELNENGLLVNNRINALFDILYYNVDFVSKGNSYPKNSYVRKYFNGSYQDWTYYKENGKSMGYQFQPTNSMQKLLNYYNKRNDDFLKMMNETLNYLVVLNYTEMNYAVIEYYFEWYVYDNDYKNYRTVKMTKPPWISGMAQGYLIEALGKAYYLTKDEKYLNVSELVLNSFYVPWNSYGIVDKEGNSWHYLEYAYTNESKELNGFLSSLLGLYKHYDITGNKKAKQLFDKGINWTIEHLQEYDTGSWSLYSLTIGDASLNYHKVHIKLLRELYKYTSISMFNDYADKWEDYID